MGSKASALRHHRHGSSSSDEESTGSSTTSKESTGTRLESKISGSIGKLRKRGGSRGGSSLHKYLKEEQFCGIAKIQLTSVEISHHLFFSLTMVMLLQRESPFSSMYDRESNHAS